jgi:hypothetical protein
VQACVLEFELVGRFSVGAAIGDGFGAVFALAVSTFSGSEPADVPVCRLGLREWFAAGLVVHQRLLGAGV